MKRRKQGHSQHNTKFHTWLLASARCRWALSITRWPLSTLSLAKSTICQWNTTTPHPMRNLNVISFKDVILKYRTRDMTSDQTTQNNHTTIKAEMTADATMIEDLAPQWIGIGTGLMTIDHRIDVIVLDEVEDGNKALNHSIHALHDALNKLFCTVNFCLLYTSPSPRD